eukprot:CAMPEP_0172714928 /NCGR_PEP_ID=MMETSP1074-20121228/67253_1 /TAXON_ID=2916 /ORGANISM="Ceratium fusus, Strain PA161109" /LENGTH=179 /DNA_ID=CAMNT_0013539457 /DNA_START=223 /DNA_END=764 /DNA_ORIENTATION=+
MPIWGGPAATFARWRPLHTALAKLIEVRNPLSQVFPRNILETLEHLVAESLNRSAIGESVCSSSLVRVGSGSSQGALMAVPQFHGDTPPVRRCCPTSPPAFWTGLHGVATCLFLTTRAEDAEAATDDQSCQPEQGLKQSSSSPIFALGKVATVRAAVVMEHASAVERFLGTPEEKKVES